jgi:MFS transporter, FSR family, fosmidomycin resistance protein
MNQTAALNPDPGLLRRDAQVIGLVGLAHSVSHFSQLLLAPLFPLIKAEFGVSYAELGLLMSVFFVVSGVGQALAGFVVDRVGARPILFCGIALLGLAALGMALSPNYYLLLVCSGIGGLGNCVFHPADFTLLNKRVSKERLGHAFSAHGITGFLGWAAAPIFLTSLAVPFGWRGALFGAALLAFAVLALLWTFRERLAVTEQPHPIAGRTETDDSSTFSFLGLPLVWMCFAFFLITALAFAGIQSFAPASLQSIYAMTPWLSTASITAYMLASAGGTVVGGFLAGKFTHHEKIIGIAFALAGMFSLLVASGWVPTPLVIVLLGIIGFGAGIAGPSRDLLVRAASPKNATGRVYGVVYSGMDCGQAIGPLLFGALMDAHHPAWVFVLIGTCQVLALATAMGVGSHTERNSGKLPQVA